MAKTLFIVNPHAGRTRRTWRKILPRLHDWVNDYTVVMTRQPEDVLDVLNQAARDGVERIITVGGDGTNKFMLESLMQHWQKHPDHQVVFGSIPAGTGRDFARGTSIPMRSMRAAEYVLTKARPRKIDIGLASYGDSRQHFLNVSSTGIARDVTLRVERSSKLPWSFFVSVVSSLARYQPEPVRIELDGEFWFEGHIYIMAVANGKYFGQGIKIAPDAEVDDGFFDVVIAEEMSTPALIQAFPTMYSGTHITNPKVKVKRAQKVTIAGLHGKNPGMDLDGEPAEGANQIHYEIIPGAIRMLL